MNFDVPTAAPKQHLPTLTALVKKTSRAARQHKKGLAIAAVALFLFHWYELRPMQINNYCDTYAAANARVLLQSKAEITTDEPTRASYNALLNREMYLRTDYESFYARCLRDYGIFVQG